MGAHAKTLPVSMTVDEFIAWPGDGVGGRYQLVDGQLRAMSPASATHATIQANLAGLIREHLIGAGARCRILTEPAVHVRLSSRANMRVPDLGVTCARIGPGDVAMPEPILLIEILSPGNASDTWDNVRAFATIPSVREIVILASTRIAAEVLRREDDGSWPADPVPIADGGMLDLASIGCSLPLREVYGGTYLVEDKAT